MRLGIHLPQYGRAASPEAIQQVAVRAEEIGLADVWVSDHIVYPADQGYPASYLFDPLLTLSWAASATRRIGLGTSVMVVPQYHPLHLANSLASLDQLSGGRLTVGAGVGWSAAEYSALGQDFHTRGARMDEALEIMRLVWTESPASYQGNHYEFEDIKVLPQPAHAIPVWVGGSSQPAYDRAAMVGDGFQGLSKPPEEMGEIVAGIRAQLAESRPDAEFTFSYRTGWDPQGMEAAQIRDERDRYVEAGVEHVVSAPWRTDADAWIRSMELLVEIVEPDLITQ
ncbi:MAG: LLM class F420-dependent oxidoreductase [Acidimicrobiia bacterium]|nr:LLM class F420-dependent oxidoreductase [Acidimicrobiia bacterium]MYE74349.1 LLM class F420-dependent oxidoreductase [Acidimicrobiia bacterium]MYJ62117.1 LLM class F420-dependent oxidoreductase [Acidimicrobiia bacterium]